MKLNSAILLALIIVGTLNSRAAEGDRSLNQKTDWKYIEQVSAEPQGGIIIRYPDVLEPRVRKLSEQLGRHGWSSLLVPIELSDVTADPLNNTYDLIELMSQKRGQLNLVLLTFGNAWDTSTSIEELRNLNVPIQGVVFVDVPGSIASVPDLPTLDIATTVPPVHGFKTRQSTARRDKVTSTTNLSLQYSTRGRTDDLRDDRLTRRIRGWLQHNLRGMEVNDPS